MGNPQISVVMPVYNDGLFLNEAIESILSQTYSNFEFIIINDGSTDNSLDIIKSYKDQRIIILQHNSNKGITKALNYGLANARSRFIARMDANDIALSHRFEKQIQYLKKEKEIGLVSCFFENINPEGAHLQTINRDISPSNSQVYTFFRNYISHSSVMIDRDIIKNIKYDEDCAAEDFELWMKLSDKTEFYIIPDVMMKIRLENGGLHERNHRNIDLAHKKILKQILGQLGIDANNKEIKFHVNYHKCTQYKCLEGKIILDYFEKLFIGNQRFQVFREPAFSTFLFTNWFHVIKYLEKINIGFALKILSSKLFYLAHKKKLNILRVLFKKFRL